MLPGSILGKNVMLLMGTLLTFDNALIDRTIVVSESTKEVTL